MGQQKKSFLKVTTPIDGFDTDSARPRSTTSGEASIVWEDGSCQQIVYDAGGTLLQHWVCCTLSGSSPVNTCYLPNTVSMLVERIRHWPAIETPLGDCPVFESSIRITMLQA